MRDVRRELSLSSPRSIPHEARLKAGALLTLLTLFSLSAPRGASAECFAPTELETSAKVAFYGGERNTARTRAEAALKAQEEPILGAFILALIYSEMEGNFPKSLYWLRRAERWLIKSCSGAPKELAAQSFHRDLIIQQSFALGDMDRRAEQLEVLMRYETLYSPPRDELKIWPLVKLGRFEEARALAMTLIQTEDPFVRSRAFNGLMAVECEARERRASYEWGMKGHMDAREQSCVIALNMGLASRQCFLFDEEVRFNRLALNASDQDCSSSPMIQSSATYLIRGEFQKSISALSAWAPKNASEFSQSHMRVKARRAELMYSLGVWGRGLDEAHQVVTYPDRSAGTDSASEEMLNLEASLLYWAFLDGALIEERERAAAQGWLESLKSYGRRAQLAFRRWKQRRQVLRYASHDALLVDIVRPYYSNVMPWYLSTIAHVLGGGVMRGAIERARRLEAEDYPEEVNAYLDGLEAELSWVEGDEEECLRLAEQALKVVPEAARLMRYRLMALRWASRRALQDPSLPPGGLDDDLHELLTSFPTPLRILDLRLPVRLSFGEGSLTQELAEALARSPRFEVSEEATLRLEVSEVQGKLKLCMMGRNAARYGCVETWIDPEREREAQELKRQALRGRAHRIERDQPKEETGETEDQEAPALEGPVARLLKRAHTSLLSPKVELTQKELDSLDGNIRQLEAEDALEVLFR